MTRWLPELVRQRPSVDLAWRYDPATHALPQDLERRLAVALRTTGAVVASGSRDGTDVTAALPWMTTVLGVVPRTVAEEVRIAVRSDGDRAVLDVRCTPQGTHDAHAFGVAGVLAVAGLVWVASGPVAGLLPTATTLIGGALWADVTRRGSLMLLDRRLARLADDLGRAVWAHAGGHVERLKKR
jgi:hypothetical protein